MDVEIEQLTNTLDQSMYVFSPEKNTENIIEAIEVATNLITKYLENRQEDTYEEGLHGRIQSFIYSCSYRYIVYMKRGVFDTFSYMYLHNSIKLFQEMISNSFDKNNKEFEILNLIYFIDTNILKEI